MQFRHSQLGDGTMLKIVDRFAPQVVASGCFGEECTKIEKWKTIIELANNIWEKILRFFWAVCEKVRGEWTGKYTWTQEKDMYEVNEKSLQDDEQEFYLYLPNFAIIFLEPKDAKPKQLFIHCTSTWYNRLRKQTMECWMQELLQKFSGAQDKQYDPFFKTMLSKEEIARFAEGSKNEQGRRYCLPANCFGQYANGVDISDADNELRGFKDRFFPKDESISKLCKVIFRLRKICAFCREAKKYELRDETGLVIEGGNKEKIQELRDSIRPNDNFSKYVLVQAANMRANELFVSELPCVPTVDSLPVNQFFVAAPLSVPCEGQRSFASTADTRTCENQIFV
jgi:hypothetical protein